MLMSVFRAYLLAKNRYIAIRFSLFVDIFWIIICAMSKIWSLVALNLIYTILDIRTIVLWNKEK